MKTKIILAILGIVAVIAINPLLGSGKSVTHSDCVAYWLDRTATWDNAPALDTIHTSASYCGDIL